jgi:hypothetical protein
MIAIPRSRECFLDLPLCVAMFQPPNVRAAKRFAYEILRA